jgi:dTDP-4-amino-4,6-dideoxygalactose transaminase
MDRERLQELSPPDPPGPGYSEGYAPACVPIVQPTLPDFAAVVTEFRQAWESGQVTTGCFTHQFEVAVEEKLPVPHAVMVQSCTAGLMLVLRAMALQGEVILPAFTWTASAHAVVWNGLIPVFADITPGVYTLDPRAAARAITPRTAAIMPVNVFGCPPDYGALARLAQSNRLPLIYDSAQGLGSQFLGPDGIWRYSGGFGDAEVFSLSPTKVVSAMEGGLITTHNRALADKLRQMRDYGKAVGGEDIAWLGLSARVPEINAIVARHNFSRVDALVVRRLELIAAYTAGLAGLPGVTFQRVPVGRQSSGNYVVLFIQSDLARSTRDEAYNQLKNHGIQAKKYFYPALHLQEVYREMGRPYRGRLPVTETAAASGLALPLFSPMPPETTRYVITVVREIFA